MINCSYVSSVPAVLLDSTSLLRANTDDKFVGSLPFRNFNGTSVHASKVIMLDA